MRGFPSFFTRWARRLPALASVVRVSATELRYGRREQTEYNARTYLRQMPCQLNTQQSFQKNKIDVGQMVNDRSVGLVCARPLGHNSARHWPQEVGPRMELAG